MQLYQSNLIKPEFQKSISVFVDFIVQTLLTCSSINKNLKPLSDTQFNIIKSLYLRICIPVFTINIAFKINHLLFKIINKVNPYRFPIGKFIRTKVN